MKHDLYLISLIMIFLAKKYIDHFNPYNAFLDIATNIPVLFMTGFVLQGHISHCNYYTINC